ncbi:MAG: ATP-binding cassette domain-containing protein [Polyangiales bacterium]
MTAVPAIDLVRITKTFGRTVALRDVDLSIPAAQTTALIGPSGCGKSTLLRVIVGLVIPDRGVARLESQEITPETVHALRRRMGYVIQEGGLFPHLTAADNVLLMARQLGWTAAESRRRLDTLAELTRLSPPLLERYPSELSGGQRQRVSLMRALMLDPDVLLMDEPLGALDPMIRTDLQQELRGIFRELGKTVVLVTHDLHEAGFFGDRVVLLRDGEIAQQGPFAALLEHPESAFVRAFVNAQRTELATTAAGP